MRGLRVGRMVVVLFHMCVCIFSLDRRLALMIALTEVKRGGKAEVGVCTCMQSIVRLWGRVVSAEQRRYARISLQVDIFIRPHNNKDNKDILTIEHALTADTVYDLGRHTT